MHLFVTTHVNLSLPFFEAWFARVFGCSLDFFYLQRLELLKNADDILIFYIARFESSSHTNCQEAATQRYS